MNRELVVLNQSQSPPFQHLMEGAAEPFQVQFLTATGFPPLKASTSVRIGPSYVRTSFRHRATSWAKFLAWVTPQALNACADPFYLAVSNPPMLPHLTSAIASLRKAPFGVLIWDIFPHHFVHQGWAPDDAIWIQAWHAANRVALSRAEFVVTIGEAMAETIRTELYGLRNDHVRVIPNAVDTRLLIPRTRAANPWARRLGLTDDDFVTVYSGNIGASHAFDAVLGAAEILRDDDRFKFLVIGQGLGRPDIERFVTEKALENVTLMDPVDWDDVPFTLALADVSVVGQAPGTEHLAVPSKVYSSLSVGSAVLALTRDNSDLARLLNEHRVGALHRMDDAGGVARTLRQWQASPDSLSQIKRCSRSVAETLYANQVVQEEWRRLLHPVLSIG